MKDFKVKGLFISQNTPSSKNSKQIVFHSDKKTGKHKPVIIHSKTTLQYKKKTKIEWLEQKRVFLKLIKDEPLPLIIGIHFVRKSRHKYDWINICQIIQDEMVSYKWIEGDDIQNLIPLPFKMKGSYSTYDKENPGCWIVPITKELLKDLNSQLNN